MGTIYRIPSFVAIGEEMNEKFEVIEGGCSVSMRLPDRCSKSSNDVVWFCVALVQMRQRWNETS